VRKFAIPGGVDDVDLVLLPLGVGQAGGEGMFAGDGFFVEIGHRRAVVDFPQPVDGAGREEHRGDQLGFSAAAVSHHGDVADACSIVDLHTGYSS
jgi:hypothetical protein